MKPKDVPPFAAEVSLQDPQWCPVPYIWLLALELKVENVILGCSAECCYDSRQGPAPLQNGYAKYKLGVIVLPFKWSLQT